MMDYSKLSDFEINKAVSCLVNDFDAPSEYEEVGRIGDIEIATHIHSRLIRDLSLDYCNSPSHAWQLVIPRMQITNNESHFHVAAFVTGWPYTVAVQNENGLRAICEVYLMMNEFNTLNGSKGE